RFHAPRSPLSGSPARLAGRLPAAGLSCLEIQLDLKEPAMSLDRRDFLKTSCVAAGALALSAAANAGDSERRFKKAVKLSMVGGNQPLPEKFKMLKELGFDGIDIDRRVDHQEVRRAREESGLLVHGVVDYDHWDKLLSHSDAKVRAAGLET